MVVVYGQPHFFVVEAPSAYVPPHPGSQANRVGLYELVAATNPSVGEEARMAAFGAQDGGGGISIPQKVVVPAVEGAGSGAGWGGGP
jgi:hypothetical protein